MSCTAHRSAMRELALYKNSIFIIIYIYIGGVTEYIYIYINIYIYKHIYICVYIYI